jgi:hypothetical protein
MVSPIFRVSALISLTSVLSFPLPTGEFYSSRSETPTKYRLIQCLYTLIMWNPIRRPKDGMRVSSLLLLSRTPMIRLFTQSAVGVDVGLKACF